MSFGKSKGTKSKSSQTSTQWDYGTQVDPTQMGYLSNLWGAAQNQANDPWTSVAGYYGYNQGRGMLDQASGALGQAGQYNQQSMDQAGSPYMQSAQNTFQRLQNPGMDPMMDVYSRQIGQQFNEQIMPGLKGDAMVSGGLGGSRAGIAQGLAGARAGQQLQDFGAQLYGQNQDRALQAAQGGGQLQEMIANMYGQGAQTAGQIGQAYQQSAQGAQALGQFGMGVPWYAQNQLAGLLGPAVVTDKGGYGLSTGTSKGSGGGGFNLNSGFSFAR